MISFKLELSQLTICLTDENRLVKSNALSPDRYSSRGGIANVLVFIDQSQFYRKFSPNLF